jgi:hypothetical protein
MTEVTSSRSKQSSSKRDQRRLSVAILLSYGTARVLLAGEAKVRKEESTAQSGSYTRP